MTHVLKKIFLVILYVVFFSTLGYSQDRKQAPSEPMLLTLNQVWERLQVHSTSIQIKTILQKSSAENIKDAMAGRLPDLNAEGEYARVSNMPVYENGIFHASKQFPVLHAYYKIGSNAYFNLYNGNKTNLEIAKRKAELKISGEQKEETISEMKLNSAAFYLDILRSNIFKHFLLKDIEAQQMQLKRIKTFQKNGVVLKSDVLRAELKLSKQTLALTQIENDLKIANQKLNTLIGLADEQKVSPVETADIDSIPLSEYEEYLDYAMFNAYQIKISDQQKELARLNLKTTKANVSPKVGLFASYAYSYPQIFLYPYSANLYGFGMAGIKASFSISSIYKNLHKTKIARLNYELMDVEIDQVRDDIRDHVNEAYLRFKEAVTRVSVTQVNVSQAVENQRIVSNTYFNHLSLITDLLDADTQLLQTHFDLAAAKIAARFQYYQLLNITGKL
ncbi:TolC family protein [Pedobacter antarcticus]|uniref:TolC family protein n=1 Tax=Pedobacter antarcticus TaxID=34086 RepID=UPI002930B488|nr:TolC family protein [Pedobacter antarcticus]